MMLDKIEYAIKLFEAGYTVGQVEKNTGLSREIVFIVFMRGYLNVRPIDIVVNLRQIRSGMTYEEMKELFKNTSQG